MGTRSLTFFYDDLTADKPFAGFYRQMDGYPEGHGKDLAEFLAGISMRNGYGSGDKAGTQANGPGCLAAQVVAKFKNEHGIGGIYLIAPVLDEDHNQEYEYHVYADHEAIRMRVVDVGYNSPNEDIFDGSASDVPAWLEKRKEET